MTMVSSVRARLAWAKRNQQVETLSDAIRLLCFTMEWRKETLAKRRQRDVFLALCHRWMMTLEYWSSIQTTRQESWMTLSNLELCFTFHEGEERTAYDDMKKFAVRLWKFIVKNSSK